MDRVRQQERIARKHLGVAEHDPARSRARYQGRIATGTQCLDAAVDRRAHCSTPSAARACTVAACV